MMVSLFNTQHKGSHMKKSKEIMGLLLHMHNENYLQSLPWKTRWLQNATKKIMILSLAKIWHFV